MTNGSVIKLNTENILRRSRLIGDLSSESLGHLGALAQRVELDAGEILFLQDDEGSDLYVIESGSIEISILSESGKKLSLNIMGAQDVLGEIAALDGGTRTATASALEPSVLFRINLSDVHEAIYQNPQIAIDLISVLCRRLRWVSQQVEDMALLDIERRLARRLLILHRKFSDDDGLLHLSQSELADFLASTRESINKVLQAWRAEGLIELSRGAVRVRDQKGLAEVAKSNAEEPLS